MYLKIKNSTDEKQYTLTDSYAKPYLRVSGSVLPLTTNTTHGLAIRAKIGTDTYRALEYQSTSESATYYTTAVDSAGLSSTTALTRSSTSGTTYEPVTQPNWYISTVHAYGNNYSSTGQMFFGQCTDGSPLPVINTTTNGVNLAITVSSKTKGAIFVLTRQWATISSNKASTTSSTIVTVTSSSFVLFNKLNSNSTYPDMQTPWPQPYTAAATDSRYTTRSYSFTFSSVQTTRVSTFGNSSYSWYGSYSYTHKNTNPAFKTVTYATHFYSSKVSQRVNYSTNSGTKYTFNGVSGTQGIYGYYNITYTTRHTIMSSDTVAGTSSTTNYEYANSVRWDESQGFPFFVYDLSGQDSISTTSAVGQSRLYSYTYSSSSNSSLIYATTMQSILSSSGSSVYTQLSMGCSTFISTTSMYHSSTVAKTCSSTSGYSGVSSSSYESSGWN